MAILKNYDVKKPRYVFIRMQANIKNNPFIRAYEMCLFLQFAPICSIIGSYKKNYETYNRGEGFQFIARKVKV